MRRRTRFIPFSTPSLGEEEIREVVDTLRSGWLTMGPKTKELERRFAEYIGVRYAVALHSCTAALHLAFLAHGVGAGDEVLLPSLTFAATANMVVNVGAKPVFVDIEPHTFNIDPGDLVRKITQRTKALIPIHYAGHPADLHTIMEIAKRKNLIVIEDAAHAVGSELEGKKVGSFGNTACFSFYVTKTMTTGEGGMLTTNDADIADYVEKNRLHGISKDAWRRYSNTGSWRYEVEYPGWKYNMTDVQAAIGIHQLRKLDRFIRERNRIASLYNKELSNLRGVTIPLKKPNVKHAYHLYPILVDGISRDALIHKMTRKHIGVSIHFLSLHLQPLYRKRFGYRRGDLPVSEAVSQRIISLPIYPSLRHANLAYIIATIKEIFARKQHT